MTIIVKKTLWWLGVLGGILGVVILLAIAVLAEPGLFFPNSKQYRGITVYSDTPIRQEIDSIMAGVFERLDAVPIYDSAREYNLCLCPTQEKFTFFARLTRRPHRIMGFALMGSCYVNIDFLKELSDRTGGQPKYMARSGSVVHVATHELMHGYIADALGYFASRSLPEWKVEGYCEYGTNQLVAPRDSSQSILERIDVYFDDTRWNSTSTTHRPHYLWGLMMEYLMNVKGMTFNQVMADDVTQEEVMRSILDWREESRNSGPL